MKAPDSGTAATRRMSYEEYLQGITHRWLKVLHLLGILLVPIFFILDSIVVPQELLPAFAWNRAVVTALVVLQLAVIHFTPPSRFVLLHAYLFSVVVGGAIALMTTQLGGFNSPYYAGLNLVIMGVNLLVPWEFWHAIINSVLLIGCYVVANVALPSTVPTDTTAVVGNLFFMFSTAFISVAITLVKQSLVKAEFLSRMDLQATRDALWSEMEVAERIQTSLLPRTMKIDGYALAAQMHPAEEVGGDYYDVIQTPSGETWVAIGDVSGHGVESGLIMMMSQTAIFTAVNRHPGLLPSRVLEDVNGVIKENMARLGTDRYMTVTVARVEPDGLVFAGRHQDILVYRAANSSVEVVPTSGTWIGIVDDVAGAMPDTRVKLSEGDVVLLFTDGVTEAANAAGQVLGDTFLVHALQRYGTQDVNTLVQRLVSDVMGYLSSQRDDVTVLAMKRVSGR